MTPRTHYVYRVYDDQGLLLYVGRPAIDAYIAHRKATAA